MTLQASGLIKMSEILTEMNSNRCTNYSGAHTLRSYAAWPGWNNPHPNWPDGVVKMSDFYGRRAGGDIDVQLTVVGQAGKTFDQHLGLRNNDEDIIAWFALSTATTPTDTDWSEWTAIRVDSQSVNADGTWDDIHLFQINGTNCSTTYKHIMVGITGAEGAQGEGHGNSADVTVTKNDSESYTISQTKLSMDWKGAWSSSNSPRRYPDWYGFSWYKQYSLGVGTDKMELEIQMDLFA